MGNQVMLKKLNRFTIVSTILIAVFIIYVAADNINSKNMTWRQKISRSFYPALMWISKTTHIGAKKLSNSSAKPLVSFYSLTTVLNDGSVLNFETLKGKKILLVNTASDCGYTNQYSELQKLSVEFKGKLEVIGFPANDFKEQEKGSDQEIASFCKSNFGISFPVAVKSSVIKGATQNPVFNWLSDSTKNGWNNMAPSWNFAKYLVNENGYLVNYFDPGISPLSKELITAVEKKAPSL